MHAPLRNFLDRSDATAHLMAHARLLMKLSGRFAAIAPAGLAGAARVANYKAGKLVIHADNGAVATKLRQMGLRLCAELSKNGPECSELVVKVQPPSFDGGPPGATVKPLSARTCGALRDTAASLPAGPLREALDQLLSRAAKAGD